MVTSSPGNSSCPISNITYHINSVLFLGYTFDHLYQYHWGGRLWKRNVLVVLWAELHLIPEKIAGVVEMFPVWRTGLAWFSLGRLQHIDIGRVCSHSTVQYSLHQSSVLTDSVGGPVAEHWVPVVLSPQVGHQLQPCSNSGYSNVSHGNLH